jgi:hypothetical protein
MVQKASVARESVEENSPLSTILSVHPLLSGVPLWPFPISHLCKNMLPFHNSYTNPCIIADSYIFSKKG